VICLQQRQGNIAGAGSQVWPRAGVRVDGMFDGRVRFGNGFGDETTFSVPAEKCGLIIGKGACEKCGLVIGKGACERSHW